jgi:hypothetical protein
MGQALTLSRITAMAALLLFTGTAAQLAPSRWMPTYAAVADPSSGTRVPLVGIYRRCDFSEAKSVSPTGYGIAEAVIGAESPGKVVARVQLGYVKPVTYYEVRLIQAPRTSAAGCGAGASGTATTGIVTDSTGAATVSLEDDIIPGATGAWLLIQRPSEHSQTPAEFYTSDFIAAV